MIKFFLILLICINSLISQSQVDFNGVWQGILIKDGQKEQDALIFYVNFIAEKGKIAGKTRAEFYNTDLYAVQKITGTYSKNIIEFKETVIESKKSNSKTTWCSSIFKVQYIDSNAYLIGTYSSSSCKRYSGKIILYRSKAKFSDKQDAVLGHAWLDKFILDYKNGKKSPELRDKEMNEFVFEPIYFDYDKYEINEEYYSYLKKMIEIVNGHSDLRILATGHTDSDGSDSYNEKLSLKRAKAIEEFFKNNGLDISKLKIDYKGETEPIDSNETSNGKHRNRRVDFKFIYF